MSERAPRDEAQRRRSVLIVCVVAIALAAAAVIAHGLGSAPHQRADRTAADLVLPDQIAEFAQIEDALTQKLGPRFDDPTSTEGVSFVHQGYRAASGAEVFVVGMTARRSVGNTRYLRADRPANILDRFFGQSGVMGSSDVDPGPRGGLLRCGTSASQPGTSMSVCAWIDRGTLCLVFDTSAFNKRAGLSTAQLADVTRSVRAAAERG